MRIPRTGLLFMTAFVVLGVSGCSDPGSDPDNAGSGAFPVEILVDNMGIPHIYADTDENAFFGAGYMIAKDRLYQAAMLRRFALGRLSEVLGEDGYMRDIQACTFDFSRWGRMDYERTRFDDPERAALISAWVAGINRRIAEYRSGRAPLPFGFRPEHHDFLPEFWNEEDPYIILKGAGFANDKSVEFEVALTLLYTIYAQRMQHVQIFKPAHPFFGVPPEDRPDSKDNASVPVSAAPVKHTGMRLTEAQIREMFAGLNRWITSTPGRTSSNSWALDGRYTDNGRPLIAGDPHLQFDFFGAPYPMHINSKEQGGTYDVAGFAYPGTPGIALGFNDRVIWTATTNMGDVNDIWKVRKLCGLVDVGGNWTPVKEREEQILIREPGDPVGQGRIETMVYEDVPGHGVILPNEIIDIPFAGLLLGPQLMNWAGFQDRPARWFMELNRVADLDEFEEAVDRMREMNYNLIAADTTGIAYRVGIDVPLRTGDLTGNRAPWKSMDGSDATTLWDHGWLERAQIPRSRGEERGWLATANTDPWGFTGDGRIDNDPWYYGSFFQAGYRGQRIQDEILRLIGVGDVSLEDMQTLQMDLRSTMADDILPLLAQAHDNIPGDPALAEFGDDPDLDRVVSLLTAEWDRRMARDSAGAVAWQVFMHFFADGTVKDDILLAYDVAMSLMSVFVIKVTAMALGGEFPTGEEVMQEGRDWILLNAARRTAAWIRGRYGNVDPSAGYTFADLKRVSFDDAYGTGMPLFQKPTDGGEDTLCVSTNMTFEEAADTWVSTYVSVERSVGGFHADGTPQVYVNFPVGNHADPDSADTLVANADYIEGRYRKFLFSRDEIEANLRARFGLSKD